MAALTQKVAWVNKVGNARDVSDARKDIEQAYRKLDIKFQDYVWLITKLK